ncbi:MAG: type II toxin-antitoxin system RelE/ParE family toxin [Verrucomicrobia bacterium]|jgi:plasmid stabilization system protein ParE|nr:type II toxin-antitoxin system RelE/ParE family toxin [Verrucomicrobiota bacterium]
MKFGIRRPRLVEEDQLEAARWYDSQQPGLGDDFLDESERVISALADNALLYSVRFADVRCVRLRRFKRYGVFYVIHGEEIVLLAIHHGARDSRWLAERRKQIG